MGLISGGPVWAQCTAAALARRASSVTASHLGLRPTRVAEVQRLMARGVQRQSEIGEDVRSRPGTLAEHAEQEMVCANRAVAEPLGFVPGQHQRLLQARRILR